MLQKSLPFFAGIYFGVAAVLLCHTHESVQIRQCAKHIEQGKWVSGSI